MIKIMIFSILIAPSQDYDLNGFFVLLVTFAFAFAVINGRERARG